MRNFYSYVMVKIRVIMEMKLLIVNLLLRSVLVDDIVRWSVVMMHLVSNNRSSSRYIKYWRLVKWTVSI